MYRDPLTHPISALQNVSARVAIPQYRAKIPIGSQAEFETTN